jgi:hypothetical protein
LIQKAKEITSSKKMKIGKFNVKTLNNHGDLDPMRLATDVLLRSLVKNKSSSQRSLPNVVEQIQSQVRRKSTNNLQHPSYSR